MGNGEGKYCLIRAGLPPSFWREQALNEIARNEAAQEEEASKEHPTEHSFVLLLRKWWMRMRAVSKQTGNAPMGDTPIEDETEYAENIEFNRRTNRDTRLKNLQEKVQALLGCELEEQNIVQVAYEEKVYRQMLHCPGWQQCFPYKAFDAYRELRWAKLLMAHAIRGDFLIVGYAPCIPQLLCEFARQIKSIQWTLSEAVYTESLQIFMEDYYEEYGIAINIRLYSPTDSPGKRYPESTHPVNLLDFSGEERLSPFGLAGGSVWLDMDSKEEKGRKMELQNPQISYFSLKNQWKQGM
ncbi:MAG: hypothetical protein IJ833_05670 [Lachnospiraceae bacterium]|nr:hypothetical protein [Lachnospiraceae bacterium]